METIYKQKNFKFPPYLNLILLDRLDLGNLNQKHFSIFHVKPPWEGLDVTTNFEWL